MEIKREVWVHDKMKVFIAIEIGYSGSVRFLVFEVQKHKISGMKPIRTSGWMNQRIIVFKILKQISLVRSKFQ